MYCKVSLLFAAVAEAQEKNVVVAAVSGSDVVRRSLVWDAHSGFMPDRKADLSNLEIWRKAGVDFLSVNVGFDLLPWQAAIHTLAAFRRWIRQHESEYLLADSFADIARARASGRMAVAFDLEGMTALDGRIEMLGLYRDLGVRQILFAYNRNNAAGGGCHDEDCGLTAFGGAVIDEMNRLGMTVDLSHSGYHTTLAAIERSTRPVVFSHSNPVRVQQHGRNIADEQILACAAGGGVVGVVGLSLFMGGEGPTAARLADHIEYVSDLAGPDHVGLGIDYSFPVDFEDVETLISSNPEFWPADQGYHEGGVSFFSPAQLGDLVEELLRRGRPEHEIAGVLGGNFARVAQGNWG